MDGINMFKKTITTASLILMFSPIWAAGMKMSSQGNAAYAGPGSTNTATPRVPGAPSAPGTPNVNCTPASCVVSGSVPDGASSIVVKAINGGNSVNQNAVINGSAYSATFDSLTSGTWSFQVSAGNTGPNVSTATASNVPFPPAPGQIQAPSVSCATPEQCVISGTVPANTSIIKISGTGPSSATFALTNASLSNGGTYSLTATGLTVPGSWTFTATAANTGIATTSQSATGTVLASTFNLSVCGANVTFTRPTNVQQGGSINNPVTLKVVTCFSTDPTYAHAVIKACINYNAGTKSCGGTGTAAQGWTQCYRTDGDSAYQTCVRNALGN